MLRQGPSLGEKEPSKSVYQSASKGRALTCGDPMVGLKVAYDRRFSLGLLVDSAPGTPYHGGRPCQNYATYHHQAPRYGVALESIAS